MSETARFRFFRRASLGVLLAAAAGAAAAQQPFRPAAGAFPSYARPYAAFDADGDGDQDLLTGKGVFLNDGAGRFTELAGALPAAYDPAKTRFARAADFDLDGDLDLGVAWTPSSNLSQVFYNLGGGFFSAPTWLYGSGGSLTEPASAAAGDFDGDGRPDFAGPAGGFNLQLQTSPGVFVESTAATLAAAGVVGPVVLLGGADLDGDGRTELLLDVSGASVILRRVGGAWSGVVVAGGFNGAPLSSAVGDFDGDGRPDFVVCRNVVGVGFLDEFVFQPGATPYAIGHARPGPARLGALDADGDGDDDVLRCDAAGTTVVDYATGAALAAPPILDGIPGATAAPAPLGALGPRFVVTDADGDGDDDVAGLLRPSDYGLALRTTAGPYVTVGAEFPTPPFYVPTLVADFDGDGDADLARPTVAGSATTYALYANDGRGRFGTPAAAGLALATGDVRTVVADFDGDGLLDVFQLPPFGFPVQHRQTSPGVFAVLNVGTISFTSVEATATADLDGDGDTDVIGMGRVGVASNAFAGPSGVHVLLNVGGVLGPPALIAASSYVRAATLDADGDATPDFVCSAAATGNPPAYPLTVYSGATGAPLAFLGSIPALSGYLGGVAAGDLDGDGDDDVMAEGSAWLKNGIAFAPTAGPPIVPGAASDRVRRIMDVDGDGLRDIVDVASSGGGVFYGLAAGGYSSPVSFASPPLVVGGVTESFADLDRDGDPDFIGRDGVVQWNTSAGLAAGRPAFLGRVGSLDVQGPAGAAFDLIVATTVFTQTPVAIPNYGNLWLDPTTAVYVGPGAIGPTGVFEVALAVPNVPALAGLTLWWQAVLPVQTRLTNAIATPIYAP